MKAIYLFPGQGSQHMGMGKTIYDNHIDVRRIFQEASEILQYDLAQKCFKSSLSELNKVELMLPAIFTVSYAYYVVLTKEMDIIPIWGAGHSLGEYTALCCNGQIPFSDALKLILFRCQLGKEIALREKGTMSIIENVDPIQIGKICEDISTDTSFVSVSCFNAPRQVAVSGNMEAVLEVERRAIKMGGTNMPLINGIPFHCSLFDTSLDALREKLEVINFGQAKWPVAANVTSSFFDGSENVIDNLCMQLKCPVQWIGIMNLVANTQDVECLIEIGPQSILSNLARYNGISLPIYSISQKTEYAKLMLNVNNVMKKPFKPTVVTKCLGAAVSTPNKNWDNQQYQENVVKPFERIRALQQSLENNMEDPTVEDMKQALQMLYGVFRTKGTPENEQANKFAAILEATQTEDLLGKFILELQG